LGLRFGVLFGFVLMVGASIAGFMKRGAKFPIKLSM